MFPCENEMERFYVCIYILFIQVKSYQSHRGALLNILNYLKNNQYTVIKQQKRHISD